VQGPRDAGIPGTGHVDDASGHRGDRPRALPCRHDAARFADRDHRGARAAGDEPLREHERARDRAGLAQPEDRVPLVRIAAEQVDAREVFRKTLRLGRRDGVDRELEAALVPAALDDGEQRLGVEVALREDPARIAERGVGDVGRADAGEHVHRVDPDDELALGVQERDVARRLLPGDDLDESGVDARLARVVDELPAGRVRTDRREQADAGAEPPERLRDVARDAAEARLGARDVGRPEDGGARQVEGAVGGSAPDAKAVEHDAGPGSDERAEPPAELIVGRLDHVRSVGEDDDRDAGATGDPARDVRGLRPGLEIDVLVVDAGGVEHLL